MDYRYEILFWSSKVPTTLYLLHKEDAFHLAAWLMGHGAFKVRVDRIESPRVRCTLYEVGSQAPALDKRVAYS